MIYRVYYDGTSIYDETEDLMLFNANLETELNDAGSFEFAMKSNHTYYNAPQVLSHDVEVYEGDDLIFFGRVLKVDKDAWNNKKVTCEGPFGYFNDSIQRPYVYYDTSIRSIFTDVITRHNFQVPSNRQFTVGNITVDDKLVYRQFNYENTKDVISRMFLDTNGGYIFFRKENGVQYIDWLKEMPYQATQPIQYAVNLSDISQYFDGSDIVTCVVPLGDVVEETGKRRTVEAVNNGYDYIDASTQSTYGRIVQVKEFNGQAGNTEQEKVQDLYNKALDWLTDKQYDRLVIEVKAADLHYIDNTYSSFKIGQTVHVASTPHLIDRDFPLSKISLSLNSGVKGITIGTEPRKELTEITAEGAISNDIYKKSSSTNIEVLSVEKQDQIIAGTNITIAQDGRTINAKEYKAGTNITISEDGTISATGGGGGGSYAVQYLTPNRESATSSISATGEVNS